MNLLFQNACIFTGRTLLEHAALGVEEERVAFVGEVPKGFAPHRTVDCGGDLLMPAFVNAHAHSAMTLLRSLADDLPLERWLNEQIFPMERHLDAETVYWGTMLAIAESVRGGIATTGDMYYYPESVKKAALKAGVRYCTTGGATDFGGEAEAAAEAEEARFLSLNGDSPLYKYIPGAHSEYLSTEKLIARLVDLADKYDTPLYAHCSETLNEVGECTVRHNGLTPPMYLHRMGFFDHGASIAHGVYLDKEDISLLAQSGVSVVTNPASNLKLASGVAPLFALQKAGVNLALGTDGAASNNALDMFREMYLCSVLQKCEMKDASVMPAECVLSAAAAGGAAALFYKDVGLLEPGYSADVVRVSFSAPHLHPKNAPLKHLVYSAARSDVAMTMCRGKIVYENGEYFIGESLPEIYRRAEACVSRLKRLSGLSV